MAIITEEYLEKEIADAKITLNHNTAELVKGEKAIEGLRETIAATKGAINAFEYLLQRKLAETTKPDDSDSGEEA